MGFFSRKPYKYALIITILIGIIAILLNKINPLAYFGKVSHDLVPKGDTGVFSKDHLAQFDGVQEKKLYLAILGSIFDVTPGAKHYAKGESYHYFVGKDGSRAFITGDFMNESEDKDDVLDLTCTNIFGILNWRVNFHKKYKYIGVLEGRYYDKEGKETVYHKELINRTLQCEEERKASKIQQLKYPPCNLSWNADEGSRVWCTKTSGGISRDWVGVPRQHYIPGKQEPECVCVNLEKETTTGHLKKYDDCPDKAASCAVDIT